MNIEDKDMVLVPIEVFEKLMTNCCNQNNCLEEPEKCVCCKECGINLKEMLEEDE